MAFPLDGDNCTIGDVPFSTYSMVSPFSESRMYIMGIIDEHTTSFGELEVIAAKDTYTSSWSGWTHAVNGKIYRRIYKLSGNPFNEGDVIKITVHPINGNTEWSVYKINSAGTAAEYAIITEAGNNTYNKIEKTVTIPVEGVGNTIWIYVTSDVCFSPARIVIEGRYD